MLLRLYLVPYVRMLGVEASSEDTCVDDALRQVAV